MNSQRDFSMITTSRLDGEGVCYKAKLIGVNPIDKRDEMRWESLKKLKDMEAAAKKQRKHKQKIFLKLSYSGLKILDDSLAVLYDHQVSGIVFLKEESRALAYIYQNLDTCLLFYIKTANRAAPVVVDMKEICQEVCAQKTHQQRAEAPTQVRENLYLPTPSDDTMKTIYKESISPADIWRSEGKKRKKQHRSKTGEGWFIFGGVDAGGGGCGGDGGC